MKKMKKFLAMLLAMAMVMGLSLTAFAADGETTDTAPSFQQTKENISAPGENDKGTVTISGKTIKEGEVTFKAYQLIKADFEGKNFEGYSWMTPYANDLAAGEYTVVGSAKRIKVTDGAVLGLTSANINAWAAKASDGKDLEVEWGTDGAGKLVVGTAKTKLAVGTWMIIATATENVDVVYNPMIVSVFYEHTNADGTSTDVINGGNVNADGTWTIVSSSTYQKSSDLGGGDEDKKVGSLDTTTGVFTQGEANAEVGKDLAYQLTGTIPSYAPEYFAAIEGATEETTKRTVVYTLKDSKNAGLKYNNDITVKVGGMTVSDTNYVIKYYEDAPKFDANGKVVEGQEGFKTETTDMSKANAFTVAFTSRYLETLANEAKEARVVEVSYTAKITDAAVAQVAENKYNVSYTRTPGDPAEETERKTVYSYTAAINGAIQKVDESDNPLPGAKFELYTKTTEGEKVTFKTATTSVVMKEGSTTEIDKTKSGSINFEGLKFGEKYYLKETEAPTGYSVNTKEYEIVCSYNNEMYDNTDEKLEEYTVTIKDVSDPANPVLVGTVTVPYGGSATILNDSVDFVNTTLASLPSTGGIGTTIFTIGGCAIMIIAAGLYFSLRRKSAK